MYLSSEREGWLHFVSAVAPEKEHSHRSMSGVWWAFFMTCTTSLPLSFQNGEMVS
jgi:hypothetical protein